MRRRILLGAVLTAVVLVGAGLYWFEPWRLVTSTTVQDTVPEVAVTSGTPSGTPGGAVATLVAGGELISHEHDTTGTVQLIRLADGRYQVVLRDLSTSDGPDLRVWLTDQEVRTGRAGWQVFDDGELFELGKLKGNHGTQVYDLPAGVDVTRYRSVSIWCARFNVSFGAAQLR
jgi:hypothetical protein